MVLLYLFVQSPAQCKHALCTPEQRVRSVSREGVLDISERCQRGKKDAIALSSSTAVPSRCLLVVKIIAPNAFHQNAHV